MNHRKFKRPTIQQLAAWVAYDPTTGDIALNGRSQPTAKTGRYKALNFPQKEIGAVPAHIAAFAIMKGRWPRQGHVIDHKDGKPNNNKWSNLREVTESVNALNRRTMPKQNRHGIWSLQIRDELNESPCLGPIWRTWQSDIRNRPCMKPQWRAVAAN